MIYVNAAGSDLYDLLPARNMDSLEAAFACASRGEAVLSPARKYPAIKTYGKISEKLLSAAKEKKIRVYLEYCISCDGIEFEPPEQPEYFRVAVLSDFFGLALPEGRILMQHGMWCRRTNRTGKVLLAAARIAGYRNAIYGIPEQDRIPLLFFHPDFDNILIGATGLSHFVKGRFAPAEEWRLIWNGILNWLGVKQSLNSWQKTVCTSFPEHTSLPEDQELHAFRRSLKWIQKNILGNEMQVFEGFNSSIDEQGNQKISTRPRGDCTGEITPVLAYGWKLDHDPAAKKSCETVMNRLFSTPGLCCLDSQNPCYGMLKFYENLDVFYGDDNCRAAIGCLLASEWLGSDAWDRTILRCLLSVLRTTGTKGFRQTRLEWPASFQNGKNWDFYHNEPLENLRPHSQGWMWAAFLLAWKASGHQEFLDKARTGIANLMKKFPDQITWTNGFSQEIARMLLPLALLVQAQDTPLHRSFLEKAWTETEPLLESCGAMREIMGNTEHALYPAPLTNAAYGTSEAPLIQQNGDPCCDLLYTTNFAFAGLHEAALATGNRKYADAATKMADFLVRIQTKSQIHPELDGTWFRGFDWTLWDYWGSSADIGWGAWCIESGWTNSWIATTLALHTSGTGLYQSVTQNRFSHILPELLTEMNQKHPLPNILNTIQVHVPGAE